MKKRLLSVLLLAAMMAASLSLTSCFEDDDPPPRYEDQYDDEWEDDEEKPTETETETETETNDEIEELEFTLSDDGTYYSVTGIGTHKAFQMYIPDTYKGKPVTCIGEDAFNGCKTIYEVYIPESVTVLGNRAFYESTVTRVNIPTGVERLEGGTFSSCDNLEQIHITDLEKWCGIFLYTPAASPLYQGADLYLNGEKLEDVIIPESVTDFGYTFAYCKTVRNITIHDNVTELRDEALIGCTNLEKVTMPLPTKEMDKVFGYTYDENNFYVVDCHVKELVFTGGETLIYSALHRLESVEKVTLPNTLTKVSGNAFSCCTGLTQLVIPESVTQVDEYALTGCDNLEFLQMPLAACKDVCFVEFFGNKYGSYDPPSLKHIVFTAGEMTYVPDDALQSAQYVETIRVPDGVTEIGESAFNGCSGAKDIYLPASVVKIDKTAFLEISGTIHFAGTMEQWNAIEKVMHFATATGVENCTVICVDGIIPPQAA